MGPSCGHLEFRESLEDCAKREALEETGIIITTAKQFAFTNDIFELEKKHYITIFMASKDFSGKPRILEPHKCLEWQWFEFDKLPTQLFKPIENLNEQMKLQNSCLSNKINQINL